MSDAPNADDRRTLDDLLLAAGFEVDPDAALTGRAAEESIAGTDHPVDVADPWADLAPAVRLSDEQRRWIEATSPSLSAGLPAQTLTGDDPLGGLSADVLDAVDEEIIDLDD